MVALHIAVLLYDHDWQASLDVPRLKLALQTKCSFDVRGAGGPRAAAKALAQKLDSDEVRSTWEVESRIEAIVGSVGGSRDSVVSGISAWLWFHKNVLKTCRPPVPPSVDDLLRWASTFRNEKTYVNYCGYVKVLCELMGVSVVVFDHPSLRRAKATIAKRREHQIRKPLFIRRVQNLVGRIPLHCSCACRLSMVQQLVVQVLLKPEDRELVGFSHSRMVLFALVSSLM